MSDDDVPHGPRSADACSSQMACRAASLSGGFKFNFLIIFLPYREREGHKRREEDDKTIISYLFPHFLKSFQKLHKKQQVKLKTGNKKPKYKLDFIS